MLTYVLDLGAGMTQKNPKKTAFFWESFGMGWTSNAYIDMICWKKRYHDHDEPYSIFTDQSLVSAHKMC